MEDTSSPSSRRGACGAGFAYRERCLFNSQATKVFKETIWRDCRTTLQYLHIGNRRSMVVSVCMQCSNNRSNHVPAALRCEGAGDAKAGMAISLLAYESRRRHVSASDNTKVLATRIEIRNPRSGSTGVFYDDY